ncbi:zinc finger protein 436-like [Cololabis saira]|uniref:zinc finger protein 436-like n=1 Tax=Cololabis saira TaxID=129043 RepID=UPI002AD28B96|nr:zinc finger protein 436-like [Cololabis saira]
MVFILDISAKMFPQLLKAFVNERMKAAAEEIFNVFERTIVKYEEEASVSAQEIERLRGLLEQQTETSQFSVCEDKSPPESCPSEQEQSVSVHREDPQPRHIKEEDNEFWTTEEEEEEEMREGTYTLQPPQSDVWEDNNQDDTNPLLQSQTQTCEPTDEFQETQEAESVNFTSPPALTATSQSEIVNDAEEPTASFISDQIQTEQTTSNNYQESTDLSDPNAAGAQHQCYLCSQSFSSTHQLVNHAFCFHSEDAGVKCAVCGRSYESTESLNLHLKAHKNSKCCHMCGKHYKRKNDLAEHIAGHAGVKLYRCPLCEKEYSRKGDLTIHMRTHTGEKPYCCPFCNKGYTNSGHLRKHMRGHTGERPHRCEICGRGFLQRTHLISHLGTHSNKY